MVGIAPVERLLERAAHAFGALLDILWALPAAARLNRMPLASLAVLVLAGLAFAVSGGGLGVPQAARAVPALGETGPDQEPTASPSNAAGPSSTPGITFTPVDGGPSGSAEPSSSSGPGAATGG
jgi:hypothetical protein